MADGESRSVYWAAGTAQEVANAIPNLRNQYWKAGEHRGVWRLQRLIYAAAFGMNSPSGQSGVTQMLQFCGPQANFIRFRINRARQLIKQRIFTAAGERPSFGVQAINGDVESTAQLTTARGIIDYTFRAARGEEACINALAAACYLGEGFIWARWDHEAGSSIPIEEPVVREDGSPEVWPDGAPVTRTVSKKSGLPRYECKHSWEVTKPVSEPDDPSWLIVDEPRNKFELAAIYPEHADAIIALASADTTQGFQQLWLYDQQLVQDDIVMVSHVYHKSSAAVPGGRYVVVVGDGVILQDLPCPLESGIIPVIPICPAKYFGTSMPYPESADLLAIQEMMDELQSIAANNFTKFGKQSLFGPKGLDLDLVALSQGGRYFQVAEDGNGLQIPQAVQWAKLPENFQGVMQMLQEMQNDIAGSNNISRGIVDRETSGYAMQLMLNVQKKLVSAEEAAYDFALTQVGNVTLELIRKNCDTKFLAEVVGDSNVPVLDYFTRDDLAGIKRVVVYRQNPMLNNPVGRGELAKQLMAAESKADRYGLVQLMTEGNVDALIEQDTSCINRIKYENEQLTKGIPCPVDDSDHPIVHYRRHAAQLDKIRMSPNPDPVAIQRILDHMAEHVIRWAKLDPNTCAAGEFPPAPLPLPTKLPPANNQAPEPGAQPKQPPAPKAMPDPAALPQGGSSPRTIEG